MGCYSHGLRLIVIGRLGKSFMRPSSTGKRPNAANSCLPATKSRHSSVLTMEKPDCCPEFAPVSAGSGPYAAVPFSPHSQARSGEGCMPAEKLCSVNSSVELGPLSAVVCGRLVNRSVLTVALFCLCLLPTVTANPAVNVTCGGVHTCALMASGVNSALCFKWKPPRIIPGSNGSHCSLVVCGVYVRRWCSMLGIQRVW